MTPSWQTIRRLRLGLLVVAVVCLIVLLLALTGLADLRSVIKRDVVQAVTAQVRDMNFRETPIMGTPEPITFRDQLTGTPTQVARTETIQPTPPLTPSALPTPTITPTRPPDIFVERFTRSQIEGLPEIIKAYDQDMLNTFREGQSPDVVLSWSEAGLLLGQQVIAVNQYERLTLYTLGDDAQERQALLEVVFEENTNTTRAPTDDVFFPEQRMQEMLYWLVRYGAEEGGRFTALVETFALPDEDRLSITITGFEPY